MTEAEWGYLLQKLCDVLAAAFGPGPRARFVVEDRRHDAVLVLHARFHAFGVVVVGHVEAATQQRNRKHTIIEQSCC